MNPLFPPRGATYQFALLIQDLLSTLTSVMQVNQDALTQTANTLASLDTAKSSTAAITQIQNDVTALGSLLQEVQAAQAAIGNVITGG